MSSSLRLSPNTSEVALWRQHHVIALFFLLFVAGVLIQHWQVFPYSDDWGYAVLSYTTEQNGFVGQHFTQWQLLDFLHEEYLNWSGRFFPFYLQINLFQLGTDAVRLTQSGVIVGIVLAGCRVAQAGRETGLAMLLMMGGLLILPSYTLLGGIYWFSASIAYVWGILPLLLGAWRLRTHGMDGVTALCLGVAALFHEQMATGLVIFYATYVALSLCRQGVASGWRDYILKGLPILVAASLVILAPGNFVRQGASSYANSLWETVAANAATIGGRMAGGDGLYLVPWLLSWAVLLGQAPGSRMSLRSRGLLSAGALILLTGLGLWSKTLAVIILMGSHAALLIHAALRARVADAVACCGLAAMGTLPLLLLAPVVAGRSLLTFHVLMLVPISAVLANAVTQSRMSSRKSGLAISVSVLLLLTGGALHSFHIYQGYANNRMVNEGNESVLEAFRGARTLPDSTKAAPQIVLQRLPDADYGEVMPYERSIIEKWMKRYYALPQHTTLIWR